ncbi:MAG: DNA cytosine methyltransferase [Mesorhizobium sp.]|uniref:DNA cytosine methyltransferase n=1 Tax=Mesorhizobium sp. TaxID=1871066 RepID=UPI00121970F1|nr:DNA cytosine methyltransferase [Mesorhizobium sp.]TIL91439.1 MAG: DNA cytosine methyltransferase [Mesorhizobium sp.]
MKRKMLVADLLCGAGGSSTGAQRALTELGLDMELVCVNHWPTAIETHSLNHPEARHYVQDIATVRPHLLVPEGYLDLLMASPTCTHHSVARGGKPTSDQQRSDPWHIITWLTELRVKRIIIENVWEFCGWGPVDHRTGKPIASRKGEYFHAWIETLKRLGFDPEWRKLNAADYGDATTRQRFILMARSDGRKVSWPMPTHGRRNGAKVDMFADTKPWRPAREIIDWQIKGRSIFGRKKALAPKTLARIYAGAVKFGWPEPFLVVLRQHMGGQSVDLPLPTIAANGGHIALAEPVIINGRKGNKAQAVSKSPIPTLDTKGGVWLAEPFIATVAHGNDAGEKDPNSRRANSIESPLGTVHGNGSAYAVIEPFILNRHGDGYGETRAHSVDEPTPTSNCDGGGYVVEPFVLSQASGGAPRGVSDPIPTAPTGGAHALIAAYYGANSTCTSEGDPLPTVTTKDRFGIVVPVTNSNGGATARNIDVDPIPTMTTAKGGEFAFIAAQFGEREGQSPRIHDLGEPTPTICATGRVNLIEATPQYDILFRMLEPHELAAAMGFNTDDAEYEFAGTKTEKIKQIGNAVSVSKMKACVGAIMADAAPKNKPAANDNKEPALAAA